MNKRILYELLRDVVNTQDLNGPLASARVESVEIHEEKIFRQLDEYFIPALRVLRVMRLIKSTQSS